MQLYASEDEMRRSLLEPCFLSALRELGRPVQGLEVMRSLRQSGQEMMLTRWIKDANLKFGVHVVQYNEAGVHKMQIFNAEKHADHVTLGLFQNHFIPMFDTQFTVGCLDEVERFFGFRPGQVVTSLQLLRWLFHTGRLIESDLKHIQEEYQARTLREICVEDVEDVQTYRFQQKQFRHDSIWAADFEAFTVDD